MKAGILQPGYLPWLGFFEQISETDVFVLLDDVQYTKNDWRNRNRIRGPNGVVWLTVPVLTGGRAEQLIKDARLDDRSPWGRKHWKSIESCYSKAPHFQAYAPAMKEFYQRPWTSLAQLDETLIRWVCDELGLHRDIILSSSLGVESRDANMRLVQICKTIGADGFYEGASGRSYLDEALFSENGVQVSWQDYEHPYYHQLRERGEFVSHLSVVDLMFNHGPASLGILSGQIRIPRPSGVSVVPADEAAR